MNNRWKRYCVSKGSSITSVIFLPSSAINSDASEFQGPAVSIAIGMKWCVVARLLYLAILLIAALFAADQCVSDHFFDTIVREALLRRPWHHKCKRVVAMLCNRTWIRQQHGLLRWTNVGQSLLVVAYLASRWHVVLRRHSTWPCLVACHNSFAGLRRRNVLLVFLALTGCVGSHR